MRAVAFAPALLGAVLAWAFAGSRAGGAVAVESFALPASARVDAAAIEKAVRAGPHGLVAAGLDPAGARTGVLRIDPHGSSQLKAPAQPDTGQDVVSARLALGAVTDDGAVLGNADYLYSEGAKKTAVVPLVFSPGGSAAALRFATCKAWPSGDARVTDAHDGVVALTGLPAPDTGGAEADNGDLAPYAFRLHGGSCDYYGRATIAASRGAYAGGWRVYHGRAVSSERWTTSKPRAVAVRWTRRALAELGPGMAVDVASDGWAAGADGYPFGGIGAAPHVHARLWRADGSALALAPNASDSFAHAIDARHRVIGTLKANGRFYAFLWQNGTLRTLDSILHDPAWSFETAFDFAPDGRVAGIGLFRGKSCVFVARIP